MSTKKQKQSSNYIVQGGILAGASILVRIIGLIYRIPVTRILGPVETVIIPRPMKSIP